MPEKITVVGLGFVGQPVALAFAQKGILAAGLDVNPELISQLKVGHSKIHEMDADRSLEDILQVALSEGLFQPTLDPGEAYAGSDAVLVSVGLPVKDGSPQFGPLDQAAETLSQHLRPGMTVLIRTTAPPGTTEGRVKPRLEASGLKAGKDFFLAYVPERLSEGKAFLETRTVSIVVGAPDEASRERAAAVMAPILEAPLYQTESYEAAELSKVVENAQRDVNIAIAQEVARIAEAMGLNTREVIQLANTHPRVRLLDPGPGVGGFCIPNAYRYLEAAASPLGVTLHTFRAARETNDRVPGLLMEIGEAALGAEGPEGKKAAVIGLAMKDFSVDDRQSPAVAVAEGLIDRGFHVEAYDPLVKGRPFQVTSLDEAVRGADLLYFLVRQPGIDTDDIRWMGSMKKGGLVIDAKGILRGREREIEAMGIRLWSL